MKYVVLETEDGRRLPIIFPDVLVHAHVAGAIQQAILAMGSQDKQFHERQLQGRLEAAVHGLEGAKPVSAGFVAVHDAVVHGRSESLGDLASNPADRARIVLGDSIGHSDDAMAQQMFALWEHRQATRA